MSSRRVLSRSFSADGRSSNHRTSDSPAGEQSNSYSYLHTVRPESRSTLHSVLSQLSELTQPMFETILKSRAVSETSNVKFSCVVSGYPAPDVTWYKDDVQLDRYCSLPKYEISHEGKTHTLHIYNCSSEDAAIYQVSARNSQGIVSCSGVLEVGAMTEYEIHQNYFAKLKQKLKSCQEETKRPVKESVPEATGDMKASSPERALRKRRTPAGASGPQPAAASPEQPEDQNQKSKETAVATNKWNSYASKPSATSVNAVSSDDALSNRNRYNSEQEIEARDMVDVVNLASDRMLGKEPLAKKKIKISAEGGEKGKELRQDERDHERKKETQTGKERSLSKAVVSPSPSKEQMEAACNLFQPKTTAEPRSPIKEVKIGLRKNGFSERKTEMATPNKGKSATKPPAPQKQPMVKISILTKTETTTRPTDLKKSTKVKAEKSLSAVPSSHLHDVTPQGRAVSQLLTNKDKMDVEEMGPSRPGVPLSGESGRGDTGNTGSRTSFIRSECINPLGELSSGVTQEPPLFKSEMIRPQTGGRITHIKDTSGRNASMPYTTNMATKDHMPVHTETATSDNSPPYHRQIGLQQQPSNEVTEYNTGKPSSYKHITNHKHRQNMAQRLVGSNKSSANPSIEQHQKGQEMSSLGENRPLRHSSRTQQQGQVTSAMNSSQDDAKEKDQNLGNRTTKEDRVGNKSTTPADTFKKPQWHEADVSATENDNVEIVCASTNPETEDAAGNEKPLTPNVCAASQVTVMESQLHHPSNALNPKALQIQTQESSSQPSQAADIQEGKKISESTIPVADKNEEGAPDKSSWECDDKLLGVNVFAKTGSEVCFPPVSQAPAGKPGTSASSNLLSSRLETIIPVIYVTDMDSAQENNGTDRTKHKYPEFKNKNKSAESSLAEASVLTSEQTSSMYGQSVEMFKQFKQTDKVLTNSALTTKTLPNTASPPLRLKPSEVGRAYQTQEKNVKANECLTALNPQSADIADPGTVTDNNTALRAEGSTTPKLTGAAETTNITSLVTQNLTQLHLVGECPASSRESNILLTETHLPQTSPGSDYLIQYLKQAALNQEDVTDTAMDLPNVVPTKGGNLKTEDTLATLRKDVLVVPQKAISPLAKGGESIVQMAGNTEVKKGATQGDNFPPQQSLGSLPAQIPLERLPPELIYQDVSLKLPDHSQEFSQGSVQRPEQLSTTDRTESAATDKQNQLKAPQVISKIRPETCDASRNMKLWCQFFNVISDSILRWYKDDMEIAEMRGSSGDESQVSLAVVQISTRDCGHYRCTITNEYGTDFTDYLLTSESLSNLVLCEDSPEVGEEVEMTPFLFSKGLSSEGCWGNKFFGRILTEEAQVGTGCEHKTRRVKVLYGLEPVFDTGSSCLMKVQSPIAYRGREEINLAERNIQMTKQACKIQNLARQYFKIFAAQTTMTENFGSELEVLPLYFVYRPASNIPYATIEVELKGVYVRYCSLDKAGSLVVRERSEVAQKCSSFQHWIYQRTNGNLLFTRIEGVDTIMTNIGMVVKFEGYHGFPCRANSSIFENFQSQHRCNYYCGLLHLRPLKLIENVKAAVRPLGSQSPRVPLRADSGLSPQTPRKGRNNQR